MLKRHESLSRYLALILALALVVAACGGDDDAVETTAAADADVLLDSAAAPVALINGPYIANVDQPILFSAERSIDPDGNAIVSYDWDFDNDGVTDQTTSTPTVSHAYSAPYTGLAAVTVTSSDGGESDRSH